jgi:hypothetical protein
MRRGRWPRVVFWEAAFLAWIALCYGLVVGRQGLMASWSDLGITYAIFGLPALVGGFVAWSLASAGLAGWRATGRSNAGLVLGILVSLFVLGAILGLVSLVASAIPAA